MAFNVVSFADLVGRVGGVTWIAFKQRAQHFAAQHSLVEPLPVDSLGTLLWDLAQPLSLPRFQEEFAEACSVPCLSRHLADLRALASSAEHSARQRFGDHYNMFTQRIAAGDEVWELGIALSSQPFAADRRFKSQRIEILKFHTTTDLVVRKLRLKPPGSRLDWGKSVAKVLLGTVPARRAIVMSRGMLALAEVFATAESSAARGLQNPPMPVAAEPEELCEPLLAEQV